MLPSSTVLDAVNISDSEVSDQITDSNAEQSEVLECENEQGEPTSHADLGVDNENVTEAETGSSISSTSAISLLNVLRAPRPSNLTRKRKLQCNPGKSKKTNASCFVQLLGRNRVRKFKSRKSFKITEVQRG